eukprot:4591688-Amphidinium_carterae.1
MEEPAVHRLVFLCKSGKHRSVGLAVIVQYWLMRTYNFDYPIRHLSDKDWKNACKGPCCRYEQLPQALAFALDKWYAGLRPVAQPPPEMRAAPPPTHIPNEQRSRSPAPRMRRPRSPTPPARRDANLPTLMAAATSLSRAGLELWRAFIDRLLVYTAFCPFALLDTLQGISYKWGHHDVAPLCVSVKSIMRTCGLDPY